MARPLAALNTAAATDGILIRVTGQATRPVHLEYFGSVAEIARAKAEIFLGLVEGGAAVINGDIPEAGILLLLGIDHFLDMGRSATNVLGNAIAASVVAKTEDSLGETAPLGETDLAKV